MSDRRQFFSSIFGLGVKNSGDNKPCFPSLPWFLEEKSDKCSSCEDKPRKSACLENIILLSTAGIPKLSLANRGCTFCADCANACPNECFEINESRKIKADVSIQILGCLAWNGTICRSCADVCDEKAIKFLGMFHPEINPSTCSSCGFCIGICPSQAIKIKDAV